MLRYCFGDFTWGFGISALEAGNVYYGWLGLCFDYEMHVAVLLLSPITDRWKHVWPG